MTVYLGFILADVAWHMNGLPQFRFSQRCLAYERFSLVSIGFVVACPFLTVVFKLVHVSLPCGLVLRISLHTTIEKGHYYA